MCNPHGTSFYTEWWRLVMCESCGSMRSERSCSKVIDRVLLNINLIKINLHLSSKATWIRCKVLDDDLSNTQRRSLMIASISITIVHFETDVFGASTSSSCRFWHQDRHRSFTSSSECNHSLSHSLPLVELQRDVWTSWHGLSHWMLMFNEVSECWIDEKWRW